ncbi:MAG: hypothetical protein Q7N95_02300 [Alphaproteobacteria bacterium]|nr:hypothetical protein [Alphaproteobacteria bacterium]
MRTTGQFQMVNPAKAKQRPNLLMWQNTSMLLLGSLAMHPVRNEFFMDNAAITRQERIANHQ